MKKINLKIQTPEEFKKETLNLPLALQQVKSDNVLQHTRKGEVIHIDDEEEEVIVCCKDIGNHRIFYMSWNSGRQGWNN